MINFTLGLLLGVVSTVVCIAIYAYNSGAKLEEKQHIILVIDE